MSDLFLLRKLNSQKLPPNDTSVKERKILAQQEKTGLRALDIASRTLLGGRSLVQGTTQVNALLRKEPAGQGLSAVTFWSWLNPFVQHVASAFTPEGDRKKLPTIAWNGRRIEAHDARIYAHRDNALAAIREARLKNPKKEGASSDATFLLMPSSDVDLGDNTVALIEYRENEWSSIDGDDFGIKVVNSPPSSLFIDHEGIVYSINNQGKPYDIDSLEDKLGSAMREEKAPRTTEGAFSPRSTSGVRLRGR